MFIVYVHGQNLATPDICNILKNKINFIWKILVLYVFSFEEQPESRKKVMKTHQLSLHYPPSKKTFLSTLSPKLDSTNSGIRNTFISPNLNGDDRNVRPNVSIF